jgi:putative ATP-binding cassette transporter
MLFVPQYRTCCTARPRRGPYPAAAGTFATTASRRLVLLAWHLAARPTDRAVGQRSRHEQQRLALARVLVQEPDWIFLDKATSALDEAMEKRVYELLAQRLPRATIVTMAHRPEVARYHTRSWTLAPGEDGRIALHAA